MRVIEELPDLPTTFYAHTADLDVESTYPSAQMRANVSKETTVYELVRIEGLDELTQRSIGVNLTGGHVNAVEICAKTFGAATFDMLLREFQRSRGIEVEEVENIGWINDYTGDEIEDDDESTLLEE